MSSIFLVFLFPCMFMFGFHSYVLAKEIPLSPVISVAPEQYYPLDDTLYLEGKAAPYSGIEILFERVSGGVSPVRVRAKSNSAGEWFLYEKIELASGEWYARARVFNDPPSDWSNPRIIRSNISGLIIGGLKIKYISVVLWFLALFIICGALLIYLLFRIRLIRKIETERYIKQKTEELEKKLKDQERREFGLIVEHDFGELRKNLLEELEHLESKGKNQIPLSQEEEQHRSDIIKKIHETEEKIEQKVKNLS